MSFLRKQESRVDKQLMKQFKAKIISNKKIAPEHYILSFKTSDASRVVKPGQFFNIRVTQSYEPLLRRPFGAHKIYKDKIVILYKVVGKATRILASKKKSDLLDIIGPLGNGFTIRSTVHGPRSTALLIAGGHGVAPLYALAKQLQAAGFRLQAFIGAKTKEQIVCDKEFRKLGAKVYVATEDGSKGYKGLVTELIKSKVPVTCHLSLVTVYACGPNPMLKAIAKLARQRNIPCQVSLEEYIACGIGTCLGCAIKTRSGYKLVCKDGPVFDAKEIVWQ